MARRRPVKRRHVSGRATAKSRGGTGTTRRRIGEVVENLKGARDDRERLEFLHQIFTSSLGIKEHSSKFNELEQELFRIFKTNENPEIRRDAVLIFANLKAVNPLIEAMEDRNERVGLAAVVAIGDIAEHVHALGSKKVAEVRSKLEKLRNTGSEDISEAAADALEELGG